VTGSCENFDTGEESRVYPAVIVWANAVTAYLLHKLGHLTVNTYAVTGLVPGSNRSTRVKWAGCFIKFDKIWSFIAFRGAIQGSAHPGIRTA
jgi:hypothetical protein